MEKKYYHRLALIAAIGVIMVVIVATVFGIFFTSQLEEQQFRFFNSAIDNVQIELDQAVKVQSSAIATYDGSGYLAGYDICGTIDADGNADLYRKTANGSAASTDQSLIENVKKAADTSTIATTADFFKNSLEQVVYLSTFRKLPDGSFVFLMSRADILISSFQSYDFTNLYVLSADGALLYVKTQSSAMKLDFINQSSSLVKNEWNSGETTSFPTTLGGIKVAMSFAKSGEHTSLRMGGYMPFTAVDKMVNTYIAMHAAEIGLSFILFSAISALALLSYRRKHDVMGYTEYVYSYIIKITKHGKILSVSKPFRENFDTRTVTFDLEKLSQNTQPDKAGQPLHVDIMDKLGRIHHFMFVVLWAMRGYKLCGCDNTENVNEFRRLRTADLVDSDTGLPQQKQFDTLIASLCRQGKGVVGTMAIIRANNLDKLRIMMGKHFFFNAIKVFADTIKIQWSPYGELYLSPNNDIIFFTTSADSAKKLTDNIGAVMAACNKPVRIKENLMQLGVKAGIVLVDTGKKVVSTNNLIATGNAALQNAVNAINSDHYIMRGTSFAESRTDFTAPGLVERMIAAGEIDVYYQPQYDIKKKKIVAFESLCRLVGPKSKEIGVQDFISIAETYGGMIELGRFIYNNAMDFAREVQDYGICISINVSPLQLMQMGFTEKFIEAFENHGLKPNSVAIEITEQTMVYSFSDVETKLNLLHSKGIYTHIDDFGVAYSTMIYLKKLPVSTLKIDKSLVDDICESREGTAIVKNIINLTKDLGFESIAEAVETEEQLTVLEQLGCDMIQGFLIGRAVPRAAAYDLIKEQN